MRKNAILFIAASFAVHILFFNTTIAFGQGKAQAFEISKNLDIYATLFKELNNNYVDEINPGELNTIALEAMLESLDPYTIYIPESKVEEVRFMTTGEYGGIGLSVVKREGKVFISMMLDKSPALEAGLLVGDEIISVDDQLLSERSDAEISMLLKGQPGTSINILVKRQGVEETFTLEVFRRKINVESIPYYGMLDTTIAYINLNAFTKKAARDVSISLQELKKNNPEALIFDLRGNGGGLLGEAVNIMNLFIAKDVEVVRTKSRLRDKNYIYKTRKMPLDTLIPIVFLVDRNSASASEILCGAAQDLDRAVIMGERTFGKGLVQNVIPLSFNAQMKVTIAKYYIPSGRCVQAIDYEHKDENGNAILVNDSLLEAFKTKNGRTVYDGRGIKPDVVLKPFKFSELSETLMERYIIFDFSTHYRLTHDSIPTPDKFEVTDEIWASFLEFISDKDISYKSDLEKKLKALKMVAEKEGVFDDYRDICAQIQQKIDDKKEGEFTIYQEEIKRIIKTDIVSRYYFEKGVIIANLYQDKAIARAIELLRDNKEYSDILQIEKQ